MEDKRYHKPTAPAGAAHEQGRGRDADRPRAIPKAGWGDVLKRTWAEQSRDNVSIVAAGVAFLSLLAIFPALSATFAIYGLVSDPQTIEQQISGLTEMLPEEAAQLIEGQMTDLAAQAGGALSFGLIFSLLVAIWSAGAGVRALMTSLNIAYDERERRGMLSFYGTAIALTIGFILLLIVTLSLVVVVPAVIGMVGLGRTAQGIVEWLRWPILMAALVFGLSVLYRYGPCRADAKWRWLTPGALAATVLWLLGSIAFSIYIANFADYNATYGSLGAAIILLLWLYLGAYAVLLGAELDAELEHQTARDSTTGPEKPMGRRGARVADTLGHSRS